ncbi:glycosyltransferase [Vibrio panuliri]|uniref:Glycosyltransferase n=1 Tax=Vibrio panuliri TaxID=1381081 RepID=A0ABX3FC74_9VIBR|nr:glycosyltransferase [Vibrio panuliri]KAB1454327.1 glycosyltransferase [Vibrio panuliri]OLQ89297.1 glycosyltransferase [Vibrio panuliri]
MHFRQKILFVHYGDNWIRGSERCLLDLITHLDSEQFEAVVWTNNSMLIPHLKQLQVEYQIDNFPILLGWQAPKADINSWAKLVRKGKKLIKQHQIDLVHVNSAAPCQWMSIATRQSGCPMLTHLHSDYLSRDRTTLGVHLSPFVMTASHAISHNLLKDGYPKERLNVVHNGINIQRLEEQPQVDVVEQLELDDDAIIYATVGSLIHRKGVDRILIALRHLLLEYPNSHLVVIGDGEERDNLQQACRTLHLEGHVHFVGEQSNVVGWLKGCHAFVSAAREEAFGLVIAEAAVANLPIVAPFEGGIPEVVQHGETALLFANHGYGPLLDMMRCIQSHPYDCQAIAHNAHKHVKKNFTVERYVEQIEHLYQQILQAERLDFPPLKDGLKPIKTAIAKRKKDGGDYDSSTQHHL